ncbi:MAG: hypothetical protein EXS36_03325 [Pedosphaera sp.]|nr:hypothetical protein [Pedosphaera sp.]
MSDSSHSAHGPSDAGDHDDHDVASHLKTYWAVFAALLFGTVLTVLMAKVQFNSTALTICIALFIATIKAFLVAGFFMHLLSEKKTIYVVMVVTVIFFFALGGLTLWCMHDMPQKTETKTLYVP